MAWTTPQTWTTDQVVDAADLNTDIRDNMNYLYSQVATQFQLFAAGGRPPETAGCAPPTQIEFATNKVNLVTCAFDDTIDEYIQWTHSLPSDYGGGTITAKFYWYCPDASTDAVRWGIQAQALGDSDVIDGSWGSAQGVTDANNGDEELNISGATPAATIANTPVADDMVLWRAYRSAAAGAPDTLEFDALLHHVVITYVRT